MVRCGVDTNILLSLYQLRSTEEFEASRAISSLLTQNAMLFCTMQNLSEFWNVCTRPLERNGAGLDIEAATTQMNKVESAFHLLLDTGQSYRIWRDLLARHAVRGVQVHDARIAAILLSHGVTHLLTFNVADFRRYDGLTAVHPHDLAIFA